MDKKFLESLKQLQKNLHYQFQNVDLLIEALTHTSYANEHTQSYHNERLEFLGDSVLGLICAHYLFNTLSKHREGALSVIKADLIDRISCSVYAEHLDLFPFLLLGKGEQEAQGKTREKILANALESVLGAIYLDAGFNEVHSFFLKHFTPLLQKSLEVPKKNYKALFQEYAQKHCQACPEYKVLDQTGPSHQKHFVVQVYIKRKKWGKGEGKSKKQAEQNAAKDALDKLEQE